MWYSHCTNPRTTLRRHPCNSSTYIPVTRILQSMGQGTLRVHVRFAKHCHCRYLQTYHALHDILSFTDIRRHQHCYCMLWSYCYTDTLYTISGTRIHQFTRYHHFIYLISSLHECSIHSYLMFTHYCYICSSHECTCMPCFYLLVIWITVHITCIIVPCYPCIPVT